jgi:hypothetical protein
MHPINQTQNLASKIHAVRAKIDAILAATKSPNAASATTPATRLPPGARSTQTLLAELNSIQDPCGQSAWFAEHYREVKLAQWMELHAREPQKPFRYCKPERQKAENAH